MFRQFLQLLYALDHFLSLQPLTLHKKLVLYCFILFNPLWLNKRHLNGVSPVLLTVFSDSTFAPIVKFLPKFMDPVGRMPA
jgi:hypothetical protein